ncbi:hypothetical protein VTL71DRAFT_2209 [Oculimacula yallundae]|uniref:NAD dependent epimerase/dehydratase n=1 Tax=Oculimacula yallundae TaxID=86028 RepID=A0ABR4C889_9HELO
MGGVVSHPDPTKSIQVIRAAASRTGTSSLQLALQILLGGPVLHGGTQNIYGPDDGARKWNSVLKDSRRGRKEEALKGLREITSGYVGICDFPVTAVMPEVMELYPDTKVILMTRDPEKWWKAMQFILDNGVNWWAPALGDELIFWLDGLAEEAGVGKKPGEYGPYMLDVHNKRIMDLVLEKDNLLVMKVGDWKPLCEFLGKPIPNVPFPRVNEAETAQREAKVLVGKLMLMWLGLFGLVGTTAYGSFQLWKMQFQ